VTGSQALSEGLDPAGGYRWEWRAGDVATALTGVANVLVNHHALSLPRRTDTRGRMRLPVRLRGV